MPEVAGTYVRAGSSPGVWSTERDAGPARPALDRWRRRAEGWLRARPGGRAWIVDQFHQLYYETADRTWHDTRWRGVPVNKCPLDLWIYQEVIHALRPQLVVETGTLSGGSARYFGDLLDLVGDGAVVSIDLDGETAYPPHDRVTYVTGSSTDPAVVEEVAARAAGLERVMVVLDADHRASHVAAELEAYHGLVTTGSLLVVEDTNVNGHPVLPSHGPGPMEAVGAFLRAHPDFTPDAALEKFFVSFNPSGWLRRR